MPFLLCSTLAPPPMMCTFRVTGKKEQQCEIINYNL